MVNKYTREILVKTLMGEAEVPHLFVMAHACDECLFTKNRLVDKKRADQIVDQCQRDNTHFICHKATLAGDKNVACRAYYNRVGDASLEIRLAHKFGFVVFVEEADFDVLPKRVGTHDTGEID